MGAGWSDVGGSLFVVGGSPTADRLLPTANYKMVPRARLELARLSTLDPKSSASANFATSAHRQIKNLPNPEAVV